MNGNGLDIEKDIVEKIYSEFETKKVNRVDGAGPIGYWKDPSGGTQPACWQPSQMLVKLDARCGGWAPFFENVLCIQGITSSKILAPDDGFALNQNQTSQMKAAVEAFFGLNAWNLIGHVKPNDGTGTEMVNFLVEKWNVPATAFFVVNEYLNIERGLSIFSPDPVIPIAAEIGVIGQGNANPRSEFDAHALVEYAGVIYDPSYGTKFNSKLEWEAESINSFGTPFLINIINPGTGKFQEIFLNWIEKLENPSQLELNY